MLGGNEGISTFHRARQSLDSCRENISFCNDLNVWHHDASPIKLPPQPRRIKNSPSGLLAPLARPFSSVIYILVCSGQSTSSLRRKQTREAENRTLPQHFLFFSPLCAKKAPAQTAWIIKNQLRVQCYADDNGVSWCWWRKNRPAAWHTPLWGAHHLFLFVCQNSFIQWAVAK